MITKSATSMVRDLVEQAENLRHLRKNGRLHQGELKELFVERVLRRFLPTQLNIGTGIVVNTKGSVSLQTDIVIYDNRILPPFIQEQHLGIYPVESVIGAIEVKTTLTEGRLAKVSEATAKLNQVLQEEIASLEEKYNRPGRRDVTFPLEAPICGVFAFGVAGMSWLSHEGGDASRLAAFPVNLFTICVPGKFCWANVGGRGWSPGTGQFEPGSQRYNYAEVARFIALFVDNARTKAEQRFRLLVSRHVDLTTMYIRE
ncbi:MAG: hypothetical protein JW993_17980 [Sedimentisphaerales bacterium]|nr:hypothetical protein [Sedimentisphaerales bacterium]